MKNILALKMGQSLSMTPALQQAIRLLQMASVDLRQEIQEALDSNLMLESDEAEFEDAPEPASDAEPRDEVQELAGSDNPGEEIPADPGADFEWGDVYSGSSDNVEAQQALYDYRQASLSVAPDLQEHLRNQLRLVGLDDAQQKAMAYLLDAIDPRGYIQDFAGLAAHICAETGLNQDQLETVVIELQACDPAGVAARDLAECLDLQLRQLPRSETRDLARRLVSEHLEQIANTDLTKLARELRYEAQTVVAAIHLIRSLQPHPGAAFFDHQSQYINPDLFVRKREGRWEVHLNPEIAPRIRINSEYQKFLRRGDGSPDQKMLKGHLQEARYFLNALRSRNETLLRVASEIIDLQRGFLDYGAEAMKPMVLRDIAERLGLHESTVSRATANKYMHTPHGLVELKFFFSSAVTTTEGGSCSATAIQAMIKRLVASESPSKPLSDNRLAQMLQDDGINVARRTVAKYRETLGIPPTHERRVHG